MKKSWGVMQHYSYSYYLRPNPFKFLADKRVYHRQNTIRLTVIMIKTAPFPLTPFYSIQADRYPSPSKIDHSNNELFIFQCLG